jgi:hypothetical protein
MVNRSWLLLAVLSVVAIVVLSPTQAGVQAQSPTKTPIGEPPTKPPLVEVLPTKTPLPDAPATATSVPLEAPTDVPTLTPRPTATVTRTPTLLPTATVSPTPLTRSPVPTSATTAAGSTLAATASASITPTSTPAALEAIVTATSTPSASSAAALIGNLDPPADTPTTALPIITQAMSIGGFIFGMVILGLIIWLGLSRLSRAITSEIHTASLATLRLQHEAERLARREKVVFRADSDVLSLLEQAILDASGESVHVRLVPNGWVSSPPLMAVIAADQTRYLFSLLPPEQVRASARRHGLTQLLLGQATDLTAYPIDALNSTPFIVDDLSSAFGYVLARHQAPRRPLPRTDRWYLYVARPRTSRLPSWFERRVRQTSVLRRFTDRIRSVPDSTTSSSTTDRTSKPGE